MEEQDQEQQETPGRAEVRTVEYDKFSRVVAAKRGLEQQVAELREQNQALEERASSVDTLAQQLSEAQRAVAAERDRFARYQSISGAVGSTDADVIELFEWQYSRQPGGEDKPPLTDWIEGLKANPDAAPTALRQFVAPPAKPTEPAARRASPSAGHVQPAPGKSQYSDEEIRAARQAGIAGDWTKWIAMKKDMGIE